MKNIFRIFKSDRRRIRTNVVAVVIMLGLIVVPSLYAWFNILSNWNPYEPEATSQIKVAVASNDLGTSIEGTEINMGDKIIESLKSNTTIGWVFPETVDEAIDGVYSGDYYAALIMPENFSEQMMSFITEDFVHPQLLYYTNQKKNAIAPKITDKAKTAVANQVNATMMSTIIETFSKSMNLLVDSDLAAELGVDENTTLIDAIIMKMENAYDSLQTYGDLTDSLLSVMQATQGSIDTVKSKSDLQDAVNRTQSKMDTLQNAFQYAGNVFSISKALGENMGALKDVLGTLSGAYNGVSKSTAQLRETLAECEEALTNTSQLIRTMQDDLLDTLDTLYEIRDGEGYEMLLDLLQYEPEELGEFMASPVEIENHSIFPIDNYGSAMAPFYSVLALWVGALVTVALLHTRLENGTEFSHASIPEQFFGRYIVFFLIGQGQAFLTILGNLFYIGIQCEHPVFLLVTASLVSFTFTMMMYSLTFAFGNIGQAAAVVLMVIQVAGAGGTFPIQVLPEIFQNIVAFLPFPYAMNAMRECIGGFYENDYWIYLGKLLIFAVAYCVVCMLASIPAAKLNALLTRSKERSGVML